MSGDMEKAIAETVTKVLEHHVESELDKFSNLGIDDIKKLREERLKEMKIKVQNIAEWKKQGHGEYSEIQSEKEFFEAAQKSKKVVCHFYREATFRCKIVDKHLAILAPKHIETKFIKIDVEKSPFLVDRLKIKILPTIVMLIDANIIGRILGFTELGNRDDFGTDMMEWRLGYSNVIDYNGDKTTPPDEKPVRKSTSILNPKKNIRGKTQDYDDDEEEEEEKENEKEIVSST